MIPMDMIRILMKFTPKPDLILTHRIIFPVELNQDPLKIIILIPTSPPPRKPCANNISSQHNHKLNTLLVVKIFKHLYKTQSDVVKILLAKCIFISTASETVSYFDHMYHIK